MSEDDLGDGEDIILDADSREALERTQRKLVARIERLADDSKKKTHRYQCEHCANYNMVELPAVDAQMLVRALSATSAALGRAQAQKGDDASEAATKLLRDRSALTDDELAEYISRLERELSETK